MTDPPTNDTGAPPEKPDEAPPLIVCERCGHEMYDRHCKVVCPNCGYLRDCSDP